MLLVDTLALFVTLLFEAKLFHKLYPDTKAYFYQVDPEQVKGMSVEERIALYESFIRFPTRRARYFYLVSFIKVIPGILFCVYIWKHETPILLRFTLAYGICSINFCYAYGVVFLESHQYLSNELAKLHQTLDLSETFRKTNPREGDYDFTFLVFLNIIFLLFFTFGLQMILVSIETSPHKSVLMAKLGLIAAISILLSCRIFYLNRKFTLGGVVSLFRKMESLNYSTTQSTLSLHTSPLLAQFERTYNHLTYRLRETDEKLSRMICAEAEKGRFRALGQMSALVAHDLSGPLHAALFSTKELQENPFQENAPLYIERVAFNLDRAMLLVGSLRARLKNPITDSAQSFFLESHEHVLRMLTLQYLEKGIKKIHFQIDPKLLGLKLAISQVDLIHILDNLYRNSVENLLHNGIEKPQIGVFLFEKSEVLTTLWIRDNGTGLSNDQFEILTKSDPLKISVSSEHTGENTGLGLKLIRSLTEMNGGTLEVLDSIDQGSIFSLTCRNAWEAE